MCAVCEWLPVLATPANRFSPKLRPAHGVSTFNRRLRPEDKIMKRAIAGILLLVGMGVAPALAWDGDRGVRRDIRHDEANIRHDRGELRRDLNQGNYAAARHQRRELRHEYRDVNRDRRQLDWDRR
jgi:hypothetical protein